MARLGEELSTVRKEVGRMVKIRLHGTLEEINEAKQHMESVFKVLSESATYKDRGKTEYYRIYLDCEIKKHD